MLTPPYSLRRTATGLACAALALTATACTADTGREPDAPTATTATNSATAGAPSTGAIPSSTANAPCTTPIPETAAGKLVLRKLDSSTTSFGVEAFRLDPQACQTATRLTSLPATAACAGVFPWIDGDVEHRREVLGAAGARLVASANVDGRLHQNLVVFDKTSPGPGQLARFASSCGGQPQQQRDGIRRWKIAADQARENWMLISGGVVLHLRFDMTIGEGFTAAQIRRTADDALRAAVNATD